MKLSRKQQSQLIRIAVVLFVFLVVLIVDKTVGLHTFLGGSLGWLIPFFIYLAIYLAIGYDVLYRAIRNIFHGQIFDENFLMMIASLGAFALAIFRGVSDGEIEGFDEACAVLIFYQTGEFFQDYAINKSRKSISSLLDIRPDCANLLREGQIIEVNAQDVNVGDIIVVNAGERVPLDGVIIGGYSTLDTKVLTGESKTSDVGEGDEILSGCVNLTSPLKIKITKEFGESTVSRILSLVESAQDKKAKAENFITKFARIYTPSVVSIALLIAIIPSIVTKDVATWIYRALNFLVVSCPCALVISVPLSFFIGLGVSAKNGVLIKGANYLESLSRANKFVFDKTGTLTRGNFHIEEIYPSENSQEILRLACICEHNSSHPIADAINHSYDKDVDKSYTTINVAGEGIVAKKDEDTILCGNEKLMQRYGIKYPKKESVGTLVYVAHNDTFEGLIYINDEIKCETRQVISQLHSQGASTIMLSGDNNLVAQDVASKIGIDEYKASLLPHQKVEELDNIISKKGKRDIVCFIGDGINDAPSLMRADIGIAMGGVGSDAAIEASDIVIMKDNLSSITFAKNLAKKTRNIVIQNIVFALAIKVAILILSALGITNMWIAVFGDVGVAMLCIVNAIRLFFVKSNKKGVQNKALAREISS